jgi:hypothetical protein
MKRNFLQLYKAFFLLALAGLSLTSANCNPEADPGLAPGEMKVNATVEGAFFSSDAIAVSGTAYTVEASMPYPSISGDIKVTLYIPKGSSLPYTVNVTNSNAVISYCLESANSCTTYQASKTGGSGTITINAISPHLQGTFSGTLPNVAGADSRVLSGGEFIAKF